LRVPEVQPELSPLAAAVQPHFEVDLRILREQLDQRSLLLCLECPKVGGHPRAGRPEQAAQKVGGDELPWQASAHWPLALA